MKVVIISGILSGLDQKNHLFEEQSWSKFNNLGLALGIALTFFSSMAKGLKLKVRNFGGASSYVCRSYKGKTGREPF